MSRISILCAGLLLGGCATNFQAPPVTGDHPASAEAAEARRVRLPRLVADRLTDKTKAQLENKAASDPDYYPTDAGARHDMGNMKGMAGMDHAKPPNAAPDDKAYWTCVMHPEIHKDGPGQCPKCGMTLVKKEGAPQ